MALYDLAFQAVARAAIVAEFTNNANTTPVIAHPVPNQALPFVHIGESEQDDHELGQYIVIIIHTFSEAEGPHEVKQLQSYIATALHDKNLDSGGVCYTNARQVFSTVILDNLDETWHGIQRFKVLASLPPS
jgi:hypothetical protein